MCRGCYEEYGSPTIVNPTTRAAAMLIERVYEYSSVGGNLHIAVDDWNLEDEHLESCAEFIEESVTEGEAGKEQISAERACLSSLKMMTLDERVSAVAIADGFIS